MASPTLTRIESDITITEVKTLVYAIPTRAQESLDQHSARKRDDNTSAGQPSTSYTKGSMKPSGPCHKSLYYHNLQDWLTVRESRFSLASFEFRFENRLERGAPRSRDPPSSRSLRSSVQDDVATLPYSLSGVSVPPCEPSPRIPPDPPPEFRSPSTESVYCKPEKIARNVHPHFPHSYGRAGTFVASYVKGD